jgi:acyl dehydratase
MKKVETFRVGQLASLSKKFTFEDVQNFAALSLDTNPVHLDEEFASRSLFGKRIVHGFLYSSLLSAVLGTKLPGLGSIYMQQDLKFLKPVFIDETITAQVEIEEIIIEKSTLILKTTCYNERNEVVVSGQARIKVI